MDEPAEKMGEDDAMEYDQDLIFKHLLVSFDIRCRSLYLHYLP